MKFEDGQQPKLQINQLNKIVTVAAKNNSI